VQASSFNDYTPVRQSFPNYIMHDYQQFKSLRSVNDLLEKRKKFISKKKNRKRELQ